MNILDGAGIDMPWKHVPKSRAAACAALLIISLSKF